MSRLTAVFSSGFLGGSELFNLEFLRRARDLGVEIDAIVPADGTVAEALRLLVQSLQIVEVPTSLANVSRFDRGVRLRSVPEYLVDLRRYTSRLRLALERAAGPVCCLGFRSQLGVAAALSGRRRRVCWVVHEVVPEGPFTRLWAFAARQVEAVFAYSRAAGFQAALAQAPVSVLPVRLELESFLKIPHQPPPPRVLGLVGDLFPLKNHLGFVEVVQRLRASGEGVEGLIFGRDPSHTNPTGDYVDAVRSATGADVRLAAVEPTEMAARLAGVHLLLHLTSVPESFGRVCVEAMAAGRPVVGFDHGAVAEVVATDRTGILCPVGDLGAVELAVRNLRANADLYTQMSVTARAVARDRWGPGQAGPFIGDALAKFSAEQELGAVG